MSAKEIAQVAYNAGWRGERLVEAVAIALAESSGRYWVVNSIGCVGLFQINVPVHIKAHPSWTTTAMKDPAANAAAAMTLYKGAGSTWKPWEAWTGPDGRGSDGPAQLQMGRARMAVAQIKGATTSTGTADSVSAGSAGGVSQAAWEGISGNADQALNIAPMVPELLGPLLKWFDGGGGSLDGLTGGGDGGLFGPFVSLAKAAVAISLVVTRGTAWVANPRNWLRVVEVVGGAAALFIGLKMLAGAGVGGPVAGAVTAGVQGATAAAGAVKKASKAVGQAGAAVATGGASAAAGAAAAAKGAK
jgi:hypothetical protein